MHPSPAPGADELLDALDPEQRAGRRGAARPGAGAGRRRHRQDPGDHPPDRLRRRHRGLQPHRGARGHLHHPRRRRDAHPAARRSGAGGGAGPHLPLRGAAPGALLLAPGVRRRAARAHRVQARPARQRRPPQPGRRPTRRRCATWPARSSGPRSATSAPTTTPGSPTARGRAVTGHDAATVARVFATYEDVKREPGPDGHGGRAAAAPPALLAEDERVAAAGPPAVQVVRRRRVPGRQPDPVRAARPVARRPRRASASSATRPRRSTPSPAPTPPTSSTSRSKLPRHHRRSSWSATTAPRRRWSTAANRLLAGTASAGRAAALAAGGRPRGRLRRAPRRGGRGRAGRRRRSRALHRRRHARRARSRCCSGSTPSPRRSRRRSPPAACPTSCAARPGSSSGAEVRQARHPAARQRPRRRGRRRRPGRARSAPCSPAWAGPTEAADRPRQRPRPLGVAAGARLPGRGARRRPARRRRSADFVAELDRRAAEQHAPVAEGVTLATLHAAKGLEWDVGLPVPACRRARCRSSTPTGPAAVEEERRLLYVGMTRARHAAHGLLVAGPQPRAAGPPASRPGSSPGCGPQSASDRRARRAGRRARKRKGVAHCRECGTPLGIDRGAQGRPLRGLPGVLRRGAVRAAARLAGRARAAQEKVPAYVVFTDLTLQAIAEVKPGRPPGPAADQRHRRRPSSRSTATTCSPWSPARGRRRRRRAPTTRPTRAEASPGPSERPVARSGHRTMRAKIFAEIPRKSIAAYRAGPVSFSRSARPRAPRP